MIQRQAIASEGDSRAKFFERLLQFPEGDTVFKCMQCGVCSGSCPLGAAMEFPPRKIILQARSGNVDQMLLSSSVWMCVGCYTCALRCPREIDLTDTVWPTLRDQALQSGAQPPVELRVAFQNLYLYGNMLGISPRKRLDWAKDLDVTVRDLSKDPQPVEVLWLVGCYPSYYPRNQVVSRAFARLLTALGVQWGVLGKEEKSLGDCDRLFGEEGLFEMLVESNNKLFQQQRFEKIVLLDPHSYRALEKFYPRYGVKVPAQHYTMFLADRLDQLKPWLTKPVNAKVTYHDNCCVGRRCGCYEAPRALLQAIPGIELVEMTRNRENALCCGGGGGGMWLDGHITEHGGHRLSDERIQHAAETGADILAVSCPFELSRFEDAIKLAGLEGKMQVRDIIELLAESMDLNERKKT
jgi:Fe-S oxidoreductase